MPTSPLHIIEPSCPLVPPLAPDEFLCAEPEAFVIIWTDEAIAADELDS
jgi:hypothetical protein